MRQILIPIQFVLPILACLYLAAPLSAQELRENERGEKIIVYPDGSWQYFNRFPAQDDRALTDRPEKYPVYEGKVESRRDPFQATETDARKIAERKAQLARQALEIADERARQATAQRQELEKRLDEADRSASLEKKVEVARQAEDQAMKEMNLAREEAREAELLVSRGDYLTPGRSNAGSSSTANPAASNFEESLAWLDAGKPAGTTAGRTVPVARECAYAFEGEDDYTGKWRRDVQKQLLFTHTDERLRIFLKGKEYLKCEAYMTSIDGGYRFLSLQFTFAYPNAREAYGFIEKGSVLTINLLNGEYVNLRSGKMDKGSYDTRQEELTYIVHYPIDPAQARLLRRSEVDQLRVFWSSGYEEYEVYQADFFMHQINCLEN